MSRQVCPVSHQQVHTGSLPSRRWQKATGSRPKPPYHVGWQRLAHLPAMVTVQLVHPQKAEGLSQWTASQVGSHWIRISCHGSPALTHYFVSIEFIPPPTLVCLHHGILWGMVNELISRSDYSLSYYASSLASAHRLSTLSALIVFYSPPGY